MKLSKYVRVIRDGHKTILFNTINSNLDPRADIGLCNSWGQFLMVLLR